MAKQTINIGASPNDGTGTPLRTAFDYTNQNFTELYTATGPSGNNIVVPGSATITGDLTVDTNVLKVDTTNDRVGVNTATFDTNWGPKLQTSSASTDGSGGIVIESYKPNLILKDASAGSQRRHIYADGGVQYFGYGDASITEHLSIGTTGIATWSVAGTTAMTLNSTGLAIGTTVTNRRLTLGGGASSSLIHFFNTATGSANTDGFTFGLETDQSVVLFNSENTAMKFYTNSNQNMTLDASGNLLVGKTSGVNKIETVGAGVDGRGTVTGVSTVATTIYTIKQSATAAMCVVFGDDGTNGFCDIVLFLATVAPKVVSSQTLYGSPAARTYSASTTNLQLALASGTLSIRTAALSTLNT
jgi:hypothetical protein